MTSGDRLAVSVDRLGSPSVDVCHDGEGRTLDKSVECRDSSLFRTRHGTGARPAEPVRAACWERRWGRTSMLSRTRSHARLVDSTEDGDLDATWHYSAGTRRRGAARGGFWQGAAMASGRRHSRSATSRPEAEVRRRQNAASGRPQQTSSSAVVLVALIERGEIRPDSVASVAGLLLRRAPELESDVLARELNPSACGCGPACSFTVSTLDPSTMPTCPPSQRIGSPASATIRLVPSRSVDSISATGRPRGCAASAPHPVHAARSAPEAMDSHRLSARSCRRD